MQALWFYVLLAVAPDTQGERYQFCMRFAKPISTLVQPSKYATPSEIKYMCEFGDKKVLIITEEEIINTTPL